MPSRVQTLRSATAGSRPSAGAREPGELYVNWADNQLGVIDAAKNAQDLLAVRVFSDAGTYAVGDLVAHAGKLYRASSAVSAAGPWDPADWDVAWVERTVVTDWGLAEATATGTPASWDWDMDDGHLCQITLTQDADINLSSTAGHANMEGKLILTSGGFTPTFLWAGCAMYAPNGAFDWSTNGVYVINIAKLGTNVFITDQLMGTV